MRSFFPKQSPTLVKYWNYKNFISANFRNELLRNLPSITEDAKFEDFETTFILKKPIWANLYEQIILLSWITYCLRQTRSRLRNKFLKSPNAENKSNYNKQRNYCVNLLRKVKKSYYANLNLKYIIDNKQSWKTLKPFYSDKIKSGKNITLIEGETVTSTQSKT